MESPFFRNHWNYPRYVPSMMEVPLQRRMRTPQSVGPKVVSIPVRFVGSEKNRSDSAVKVQKVFRGFLVRKSVKKVMEIKREVDEIGRRLADGETVDLIRNDAKERLKVSEMLMSLLFRLDSVKGVDSGVRDFRKAVIKKAIALQEKVDSIVAGDEAVGAVDETREVGNSECDSEAVDRSLECNCHGEREGGEEESLEMKDTIPERGSASSAVDVANDCNPIEAQPDTCDVDKREVESADDCNEIENADSAASRLSSIGNEAAAFAESTHSSSELKAAPEVPGADACALKLQVTEHDVNPPCEVAAKHEMPEAESVVKLEETEEVDDYDMAHRKTDWAEGYAEMSEAESQTDSSANPSNLVEEVEDNASAEEREGGGNEEERVEEDDNRMKGKEDDKQSRELLEKMILDNKKMMEMMGQLFERNEMQTRLLSLLSTRVGQLEKAFMCETLRRKKKRNGCVVDGSGKCPKSKKCDE